MTPDATLVSNAFAAPSLIAAPEVLTNAASLLAMSTSNRFLRASERIRALALRLETPGATEAVRRMLGVQAERVERQAGLQLSGLGATYVALASFATASLVSVVGAAFSARGLHLVESGAVIRAMVAGLIGAGGLIHGCFNLFRATRRDEAGLIRDRQKARAAES